MITKAVIPAAGYGTRFLPATKSQPKEMLPVVDTPTIEYVVQEAVDAGLRDILMIIGRGKRSIEEHFARNVELEDQLEAKGKTAELESIRTLPDDVRIHFVWQNVQNGLGDAIRHARDHVGNEPFAVLLGDTILESHEQRPVIRQLMDVYDEHEEVVLGLEEVDPEHVSSYGIVGGEPLGADGAAAGGAGAGAAGDGRTFRVDRMIEKPSIEEAPSRLAVASRYVLPPEIFQALDMTTPGKGGEIQLTDAIRILLQDRSIYGYRVNGVRHDIGNKLDFLKTSVLFGLKHDDVGPGLKAWLRELAGSL
ncbi:MAG: UTP--glucose-1-phosphate uridylyltransferase [Spirochaetota bacterium]